MPLTRNLSSNLLDKEDLRYWRTVAGGCRRRISVVRVVGAWTSKRCIIILDDVRVVCAAIESARICMKVMSV